jgi:phospholipid/cholesterol/gamma-HCH transport system substrate-binding protein
MRKEIILGIVAVVAFLVGLWGFEFLKGRNILKQNTEFYSYYDDVSELTVASAVTIHGYKIGTITAIDLNPLDVSRIKVSYEIDKKIGIPANAIAVIKSSSLMGGRELELKFKKLCGNGVECAEFGTELPGIELGMIGSLVDFNEVDPFMGKLDEGMDIVINKLTKDSTNNELNNTYRNVDQSLENIARLTEQMSTLIANSNKSLDVTLKNMASISQNLVDNNQRISTMLANLEATTQNLSNLDLSNTVNKASGTLDETKAVMENLKLVAANADKSVKSLESVLAKIDSSDGTLGKLINDKELYTNIESTSQHLSLLLQDLRLNPKRYVNVSLIGRKGKEYTNPENDPGLE